MNRTSKIERNTKETRISLELTLDGQGTSEIDTGIPFMDHMLDLFSRHGFFDLKIQAKGDIQVDLHHTVEDIGIVLGQAFKNALGSKAGIKRYGHIMLPMDEALVSCAVDISGRSSFRLAGWENCRRNFKTQDGCPGSTPIDEEMVEEFFKSFAREAAISLHIIIHCGENLHHVIEAMFKALGRTLDEATSMDARLKGQIPSTKGSL